MSATAKARDLTIITDRGLAHNVSKVHGINPVFLLEKIIRERILDSVYWKKDCHHLNILTILDQITELKLIGTYSNNNKTRVTKFVCLLLKLLQLQPQKEIVLFLLNQKDFKYLTALVAVYVRLTFESSVEIYETLEPLLKDRRKLIIKDNLTPEPKITYVDEVIDGLLNKPKFCDLMLPRIVARVQLEDQDVLDPRESEVMSDFEDQFVSDEEDD